MIELSCQICRDLIPLVQDGVASEESVNAVTAHVNYFFVGLYFSVRQSLITPLQLSPYA